MTRTPIVAGNWKMHKTVAEALDLIADLRVAAVAFPRDVEVVVCPPFTALAAVSGALEGQVPLKLGAQNMHWDDNGPFTGEISAPMLRELGVRYVIIGHSERRASAGETDANLALKVRAALRHGLTPIVAVGETSSEHERGQTVERVTIQTIAAFAGLPSSEVAKCVVAYEPIWAIGTGKADTPENANDVMSAIRSCVDGLYDARILYGGSMKPENAPTFCAQPNIDGGLVGGASLSVESFSAIVKAAGAIGARA